ncbi:MAG: DNA polymerase III subunit [Elusimicrobiota bacterium]
MGQDRARRALAFFFSANRVPQALLFHGPSGVGKSLAALEVASALLCGSLTRTFEPCRVCPSCAAAAGKNHPDLIMAGSAYQACLRQEEESKQRSLRVDTIRELRRAMDMKPMLGRRKIAIINDAETMEIEAANALLKILEEPPMGVVWILISSQRDRLPKTVLSRCSGVAFAPLPISAVKDILSRAGVVQYEAAAAAAGGSVGRAMDMIRAGYPQALLNGALSPVEAADALPADLPSARTRAELVLFALSGEIERSWKSGRAALSEIVRVMREIQFLGAALRANGDPKTVVLLACLEARKVML